MALEERLTTMRHRGRRDANHAEIVKSLRACGCSVLDLGNVGNGCPDLCIGRNGETRLIEVKDGNKPPSARQLTDAETRFHKSWKGKIHIVESVDGVKFLMENVMR